MTGDNRRRKPTCVYSPSHDDVGSSALSIATPNSAIW